MTYQGNMMPNLQALVENALRFMPRCEQMRYISSDPAAGITCGGDFHCYVGEVPTCKHCAGRV
jgi:hypothetical protein